MNLCIIGGGASGILMLNQIVAKISTAKALNIKNIFFVDKDGFQGGLAYKTNHHHHLLNMHASLMSGISDDKNNFMNWASDRFEGGISNSWRSGYLPRKVYREYLNQILTSVISSVNEPKIHLIHSIVLAIEKKTTKTYSVKLQTGEIITVNWCILCTGYNQPEDIYNLKTWGGFINDPYDCINIDSSKSKIGIIGTGLTAIDKILEITSSKRLAELFCFSRSGLFPNVQPEESKVNVNEFKREIANYVNGYKSICIAEFIKFIEHGIQHYCNELISFDCRNQSKSGFKNLQQDIQDSILNRNNNYKFLASISDIMCLAWTKMDATQKLIYKKRYLSSWLRYRHAMPLKSGLKILKLIEKRRLQVYANLSINLNNNFGIISSDMNIIACDCLINCTGRGDITCDNNQLAYQLLTSGLANKNEFHGIECDYFTNNIINKHGRKLHNLFALGDITKGTHFYTSGIDHILDRSKIIADNIIGGSA